MLRQAQPGFDDYSTEKYASQIESVLAQWGAEWLRSPQSIRAVANVLSPTFAGCSFKPVESRIVRSEVVEVRENKFAAQAINGAEKALAELRASLANFSNIVTAKFQVTSIDAGPAPLDPSRFPAKVRTRVRYELVGTSHGFHREQRVGFWDLEWEPSTAGEPRLRSWQALSESQSRSRRPVFVDLASAAFGGNPSYAAQLLHGSDYWRTVLDGACGIDIYGHNGVSVGDIDNDGFDDVYICQPAGLPNRLFRNRGDGTFEDITESSGVGILDNTACALFSDFNNDGLQDLIVVRTSGPLLFLNEGGSKFHLKPDAFQFANPPQGTFTGAAAADYDRDGWLDIYFCLYIYYQGTGQYKYPSPYYDAQNGPPNFMMRNNRDGTFRDVTEQTGLNVNNNRYSFCCAWNDYNRDGWPDLYVVNDFGRKNLYRNNGGSFIDVAAQAGVEDTGAGMSVSWLDYDNDGAPDLYVSDMWTAAGTRVTAQEIFKKDSPKEVRALYRKHAMGNSLFRGGEGVFQDVTAQANVAMGRWAWSSDAWDFDHDGFPDLYVVNGMISGASRHDLNSFFWRQVVAHSPDEVKSSYDYEQGWSAINELIRSDGTWSGFERNVFYAYNRDGTFSDVSGAVGLDFLEDGRAFALADFDGDGRQELLIKNRNAPQLRFLKNVAPELQPAIAFRLRGTKSGPDAIGAVVTVKTAHRQQTHTLQAGSGFLSQHGKDLFFGLGDVQAPVRATVLWPSGLEQTFTDLPVNHRIWVEEGSASIRKESFKGTAGKPQDSAAADAKAGQAAGGDTAETLPIDTETWLLAPVPAPGFSLPDLTGTYRTLEAGNVLLSFGASQSQEWRTDLEILKEIRSSMSERGFQILVIHVADGPGEIPSGSEYPFPILRESEDVVNVYNILYRYLFDRHRDLSLPTSFLINEEREIVKVYQGHLNPQRVEQDCQHIPRTDRERILKGLPFPGVTGVSDFQRNYLSYGSVFYQYGYPEQAELWFQRALKDDPSSAEALYGLGSAYLDQGKKDEARRSFERAIHLRASYPDTVPNAWNNLGLLAVRAGRDDEAIQHFQAALKVNPDHVIALDNLGNAYRKLGQWDRALEILQHAIAVSPTDPEANYSLALVYAHRNDTEHAYLYLQRALKYRPIYPEALNNLGVLYLRTGRRDQAVASFEQSIRVAPGFDQSYMNLAKVYALEGAPDKARSVLQELLRQHPDHLGARKAIEELTK
jgi:tetratricopeptide (TPR) repeat protein